jgi:uncharacterized membrane protein YeaQ/YmgE (transglycosylase-associated protein family)
MEDQQLLMTLGGAYFGAMILLLIVGLVMRKHIRIDGAPSWVMYAFVAPAPLLGCIWLSDLFGLSAQAMLPPAALATIIGVLCFHFLYPALFPDFQTDGISTSAFLGAVLGVCLAVAGWSTGQFNVIVPVQQDQFGGAAEWKEGNW